MRYVEARLFAYNRDEMYRIYISDAINCIGQNKYLKKRYYDIIHPQKLDERSGEEIAMEIIKKAGLKVGD